MEDPATDQSEEESTESSSEETTPEISIPSCIQFSKKGLEENILSALIKPNGEFPMGISATKIRQWIELQGCERWMQNEDAILQMSAESRKLERSKEYILAEKRDFQIETQITPDKLNAWLRIIPAQGGEPLTESLLRKALNDNGIRFGIHEELIPEISQKGETERILIAEGVAPIAGESAHFEELIKESEHKGAPQEREDGSVDYKNLGLFISVRPGTPLLKRIPPGKGIDGKGVDGIELPAHPGLDRFFHPGPGAVSKEDPDVIVAARVGQPAYQENTVRVDPTLELDCVDQTTGNIIFDGNVLIRGPVEAGFIIKAGQDLTILDTVECANLSAGKNISLLIGVYGRNRSEIVAGGNIEARFLNECLVRCGGNLEVMDLISYCNVESEGSVLVGKSGGRGQILGGRVSAMSEVYARIIGSASEATTIIELSLPKVLLQKQSKTEDAIRKAELEVQRVVKELQEIGEEGKETAAAKMLLKKYSAATSKLAELKTEQAEIAAKLAVLERSKIRASEAYHGAIFCAGELKQPIAELTRDIVFLNPSFKNKTSDEKK